MSAFSEIAIILLVTFGVSIVMRIMKQPLIIGYILAGLFVGPYFLNIIHSVELIELLSKIGITALLFIVGLGLSPKVLKELGIVSVVTGVGQVVLTAVTSYFIAIFAGFSQTHALFMAAAFTFSSTIIVLKLLTDKGDVNKLYGRVSIGILLVQDLVATITLVVITGLSNVQNSSIFEIGYKLGNLLIIGFILLVTLFLITTQILSRLTNFVSKSSEFLFMFSLAWGLSIAYLYQILGLSLEIGALVAGVTLSMTPYSYEISSRLKPLRDFFILMFFILLGSQMVFENTASLIYPIIIFSLFVLIIKPLLVLITMNLLGYNKKNGFLTGLAIAQISEFSLILVKIGNEMGHISTEVQSLITIVGVISIAASSYLIVFNESIFKHLSKLLSIFEFRKNFKRETKLPKDITGVIFGFNRAGPEYAKMLEREGINYMIIDFNPEVVSKLEESGKNIEFGDASDIEFLEEVPVKNLKIAISTIPDFQTNLLLTRFLREANERTTIFVPADSKPQALELYAFGASHVVLSHYIGAKHASLMISKLGYENRDYEKYKEKHLKEISNL